MRYMFVSKRLTIDFPNLPYQLQHDVMSAIVVC